MKQETGSNTPQSINKVSIQQSLDGHSFSTPISSAAFSNDEPLTVELLTPYTILVPAEMLDTEHLPSLFAANGMQLPAGWRTVYSDPQAAIVAVMACKETIPTQIAQNTQTVRYTSPLLFEPCQQNHTVWAYSTADLLYIKVYDEKLRYAEVIPTGTEADLHCVVAKLNTVFPLQQYTLSIGGMNAKKLASVIGKQFKKAVCE